jgi:acylphosphatase
VSSVGKKTGIHIIASGRVQGVGYRYYCMETARSLGLKGWVMNRNDGSVEMEVTGGQEIIKKFIEEITRTDGTFLVSGFVTEETGADKGYKDFTIKFY